MTAVTIRREFEFPSFGAWKWSKVDHGRPLRFQLAVPRAFIYLEEEEYSKIDRIVFPQGRIELVYEPVPEKLIKGLKSKGQIATAVAQEIYDSYVEVCEKLEALLYSAGQVRNLLPSSPQSIRNFYDGSSTIRGRGIEWRVDDGLFSHSGQNSRSREAVIRYLRQTNLSRRVDGPRYKRRLTQGISQKEKSLSSTESALKLHGERLELQR